MVESEAFRVNADQWSSFDGYEPLRTDTREIRLLTLWIDGGSNQVTGTLNHCRIATRPSFFALSYYWGAPPPICDLRSIRVSDCDVLVRPTIHAFLLQLCAHFGEVTVWLDVLCINQKDVEERNRQVSLMSDIFQAARGVYAWLGESTTDTDYAFDAITGGIVSSSIQQSLFRSAMHQLLNRPYWTRVWVIQEVVLARDVWLFCGRRKCSLQDFTEKVLEDDHDEPEDSLEYRPALVETSTLIVQPMPGASGLLNFSDAGRGRFMRLISERRKYRAKPGRQKLVDLVASLHHNECSDPRDRLFGYCGIASDGREITIDYSSTLVDLSFACLLRGALHEHSEQQMQRLKGLFYSYDALLLQPYNTKPLIACVDILKWMRMTPQDLETSLEHDHRDNIIVLGRPNQQLRNRAAGTGWQTIAVSFELGPKPTERELKIHLKPHPSNPRKLLVQTMRLSDEGTMVRLDESLLKDSFEICARRHHQPAVCTGHTFSPVPIHLSRAALVLITMYWLAVTPPSGLMAHFARIKAGELEERLCHCVTELVPFLPRSFLGPRLSAGTVAQLPKLGLQITNAKELGPVRDPSGMNVRRRGRVEYRA